MQSKPLYALSLRTEELIKWFWKMLTTVFDKQSGALCVGGVGDGCVCIRVSSCMFCRFFFVAHCVMWQVVWLGSNHLKTVTHLLAGSFPKKLSNGMFIIMLCAKSKQDKKWQVSISSFFFLKKKIIINRIKGQSEIRIKYFQNTMK